jgi:hypothetical protein
MTADNLGVLIGQLLAFVLQALFYFIPAMLAHKRSNKNRNKVFWINLLLGWTIVGWFVALIMALNSKKA